MPGGDPGVRHGADAPTHPGHLHVPPKPMVTSSCRCTSQNPPEWCDPPSHASCSHIPHWWLCYSCLPGGLIMPTATLRPPLHSAGMAPSVLSSEHSCSTLAPTSSCHPQSPAEHTYWRSLFLCPESRPLLVSCVPRAPSLLQPSGCLSGPDCSVHPAEHQLHKSTIHLGQRCLGLCPQPLLQLTAMQRIFFGWGPASMS